MIKLRFPLKSALILGSVLSFGLLATAQPTNNRQTSARAGSAAADPLDMMKQSLNLTDGQAQRLGPVLRKQHDSFAALRRETTMPRQERAAKLKQIHESADAKIKQILTAEQAEKWRQLKSNPQLVLQGPDAAGTNRLADPTQAPRWQRDRAGQRPASINVNSSAALPK